MAQECHPYCWIAKHDSYAAFFSVWSRNKQGQTRFSSYYEWISIDERTALESEIIRKCLSRSELQCSFLEYRGYKVIYRRYASLFFIVGTKPDIDSGDGAENNENELGMLEFIHAVVEVCDADENFYDFILWVSVVFLTQAWLPWLTVFG